MFVCLFDIDGTLLNTGGAGQAAMEFALGEMFDPRRPLAGITTAGRTDRAIVSDLFAHFEVEADDDAWERFVNAYLQRLPAELAAREGLVLPGIVELLQELTARDDVSLGLLTGNFERGAQTKLEYYGLHAHFAYGGFGDDHHHRDDVARTAVAAMTAYHRELPIAPERVWVVGDTPADVQCARAINANVVAVATGVYSHDQLAGTGPDHLFENFADIDPFLQLLTP